MKYKRAVSFLVVIAILAFSLAFCLNGFAKTNTDISLDVLYIDTTNGGEDKVWYTFTPQESGNYAFISYSVGKSEAYLFTRTINEDGSKTYNQIAYAPAKDDNNKEHFYNFSYLGTNYTHGSTAFYMPCYLKAGTKYYFAAGWAYDSTSSGSIRARLTNIDYDDVSIESINVSCPSVLSAYTDGEWQIDDNGENYFHYSYSKIIQNMTITVKYKDGTESTAAGTSDTIDGYSISFNQKQNINHWYPQNSDEYVKNTLTVTVGTVSTDYDVVIITSAMFGVKGRVVDYVTNEPIANASIAINSQAVATTDKNGNFAFVYSAGNFNISIRTINSVDYFGTLLVDANNASNNNHTANPYKLANCDYVNDEIINAKDYAYAKKNGLEFHPSLTNFTRNSY